MVATMTDEQIEKCWPTAFVMPATQRIKLLAFARAVLAADQVPEGWVLVPAEPTLEMMLCGTEWVNNNYLIGNAWKAMLAAAPASSTSPMGEGEAV
jgi:hypothetical protein